MSRFFKERLSLTRPVLALAQPLAKSEPVLLPQLLESGRYDYSLMGSAVDYRLRFFFPCDRRKYVAEAGSFSLVSTQMGALSMSLVSEFWKSLSETVERLAPEQKLLSAPDEECLNRFCIVMAGMDLAFRPGVVWPMFQPAPHTVEVMLQLAQPTMLSDLAQLSRLFWDRQASLTSQPSLLNPTFAGSRAVGGADADLVCGHCLIDIKTATKVGLQGSWLHQLLGYALLDWDDRCQIQEVGIYLSRQGTLVRWPLEELLQRLSGTSKSLEMWRSDFRFVVEPLQMQRQRER